MSVPVQCSFFMPLLVLDDFLVCVKSIPSIFGFNLLSPELDGLETSMAQIDLNIL